MHSIEPHFNWRSLYIAEEDDRSPFFGKEYSEMYFSDAIYDYVIHPQWDNIGSETLFLKLLYVEYEEGFAIIELIGEWNDTLHNDVMILKRDFIDSLIDEGITKFVLLGENVLNFHSSDDCYYEEWFEDIEDGWIACVNFQDHVLRDFNDVGIDNYFIYGGPLNDFPWARYSPLQLFQTIEKMVEKRFDPSFLLEE
ncbi:MAG: hypothetical protein NWR30_12865 [Salibacteraceae bacterium]|nr:hypothetical protein [Salibacteraceae bacterium]